MQRRVDEAEQERDTALDEVHDPTVDGALRERFVSLAVLFVMRSSNTTQ